MKNKFFAFIILGLSLFNSNAAIPPVGKILPDDTLLMLSVPDWDKMAEFQKRSPQVQFWDDPVMKPFKEKFTGKFKDAVIKPLERDLGIKIDDYTSLPHGQFTFALMRSGGDDASSAGMVLLIDTRDKSAQLKSNLADLRKKWVDAGKTLQTQKLHNIDFTVLPVAAMKMPATLKMFFGGSETDADKTDDASTKATSKDVLVFGQFESLLIIGNTTKAVDIVATRLTGSSAPVLGDVAAYVADQYLIKDSPACAWVNTRALFDWAAAEEKSRAAATDSAPGDAISFGKILDATGFSGLRSISFGYSDTVNGVLAQIFLRAAESSRQGIFKVIAGDAKDSSPPPFVPADVLKFQRWRLDGQKFFAALEKMANDISPQNGNMIKYLIDSANEAVREKDPSFDLRKNIIGNLGNDIISYHKPPAGSGDSAASAPALYLIGSPNPEKLVGSLQPLFRLMSPGGPEEREFLGRKIYTVTLPMNAVGMPVAAGQPTTQKVIFAATSAYVAISTEPSILEEYLRSSDKPPKALRDMPGLAEAMQKVSGNSSGWFGYQNENLAMKILFEAMRKSANSPNEISSNPFLILLSAVPGVGDHVKEWLDFSLLPPFEKVSKYFTYTVYANTATVDGMSIKIFVPLPQSRN